MTEEQALCFITGIIMNQSIPSNQAWLNAVELKNRIIEKYHYYTVTQIMDMGSLLLEKIMRSKNMVLHRFPKNMSAYIYKTVCEIFCNYDGKVTNLWLYENQLLLEGDIYNNLISLSGIGKHKAIQALIMLSEIYNFNISTKYFDYIKKECPDFMFNYLEDISAVLE